MKNHTSKTLLKEGLVVKGAIIATKDGIFEDAVAQGVIGDGTVTKDVICGEEVTKDVM